METDEVIEIKVINDSSEYPSYCVVIFQYILKLLIFIFLIYIISSTKTKGIKAIYNDTDYKINIHLSNIIDDKYIYPFLIYLTSLLDNRANSTFYTIHLLTNNNLTEKSKTKINKIINKFGNNSVKLIYYNLEDYFKNSTTLYLRAAVYYKLALPSLLPDIDKIIYIDGDIINLEDLTEMYNIELKENIYFGGVIDYIEHLDELKEFGISSDKYINAGVLLINLKALRENSIEKKLNDFVSSHNLKFLEQTAINCVCYNNIQVLPYKYNVFAFPKFDEFIKFNEEQNMKYRINVSELNKTFNEPTLFHYVNLEKPWSKLGAKPNKAYWWYYAKMSGFFREIIYIYKFKLHRIRRLLRSIGKDGGLLRKKIKKII